MSCNKYKNSHYKSSEQFLNNTSQAILATNIVSNPVFLQLGNTVTDTGCAIDFNNSAITINCGGLFEVSGIVNEIGTVAGVITVAMTLNGIVLPETVKTQSVSVGGNSVVPTKTVRNFPSGSVIGFIAYSDGTATGTVKLSGSAVKLA